MVAYLLSLKVNKHQTQEVATVNSISQLNDLLLYVLHGSDNVLGFLQLERVGLCGWDFIDA